MESLQEGRKARMGRRGSVLIAALVVVVLAGAATGVAMALRRPLIVKPVVALTVPVVSGTVSPTSTIGIHLKHAKVKAVSVTAAGGVQVAGRLVPGGWVPSQPMAWSTRFQMTLSARGGQPARTVTRTASWVTAAQPLPLASEGITIYPGHGSQVGMGTTWVVDFSRPVPVAQQGAVLQAFSTTESIPDSVGWHWWSTTEVDGRPDQFWPLNEDATLSINLDGMALDGYRIENSSATSQFTVVNQHLTKISATTDRMLVYNGSQLLQNFPVSLGQAGFPTISGTLVVLSKTPSVFMNSATIGYPGIYAQDVYLDVAISTDGYYIHDASWDIGDHGHYNVSYGCVEQNPGPAQWFYDFSIPGDVVEITGTPLEASEVNGEGDWNIPWSDYQVVS